MSEPPSACPRVRVVVVNHDGGQLTWRCLASLRATEWPTGRLELVLVDNASADGVADRVRAAWPEVAVVEAGANLGFGGGCNLALADLGGCDWVALVNNDAEVHPGWLAALVGAGAGDPSTGAVSPKILFAPSFVEVALEAPAAPLGRGDRRRVGVRVSGARLDGQDAWSRVQLVEGFWGPEPDGPGRPWFQWTAERARVQVPVRADGSLPECRLRLSAAGDHLPVVVVSAGRRVEHRVGAEPGWYEVPLGGVPFDVVNSAGSVLLADGSGADRGYLEPDRGQYDVPAEVFAWSGAGVLLRRSYLESVGLFEPRFFLYYEDLDLAWRGRARGWRHRYAPGAVLRHVHAASTVEGSARFQHLVERNRLLVLTRNAPGPLVGRALARHLLVSASYLRRDVLSRRARGERPDPEVVRRRLRALAAYVRLVPRALVDRRRLRRDGAVGDADLLAWMVEPPARPDAKNQRWAR